MASISNFFVRNILPCLSDYGLHLAVFTDIAVELTAHITDIQPEPLPQTYQRRGYRFYYRKNFRFIERYACSQSNVCDQVVHLFDIPLSPPYGTRWIYFSGKKAGDPSPSQSPPFKFLYEVALMGWSYNLRRFNFDSLDGVDLSGCAGGGVVTTDYVGLKLFLNATPPSVAHYRVYERGYSRFHPAKPSAFRVIFMPPYPCPPHKIYLMHGDWNPPGHGYGFYVEDYKIYLFCFDDLGFSTAYMGETAHLADWFRLEAYYSQRQYLLGYLDGVHVASIDTHHPWNPGGAIDLRFSCDEWCNKYVRVFMAQVLYYDWAGYL